MTDEHLVTRPNNSGAVVVPSILRRCSDCREAIGWNEDPDGRGIVWTEFYDLDSGSLCTGCHDSGDSDE